MLHQKVHNEVEDVRRYAEQLEQSINDVDGNLSLSENQRGKRRETANANADKQADQADAVLAEAEAELDRLRPKPEPPRTFTANELRDEQMRLHLLSNDLRWGRVQEAITKGNRLTYEAAMRMPQTWNRLSPEQVQRASQKWGEKYKAIRGGYVALQEASRQLALALGNLRAKLETAETV